MKAAVVYESWFGNTRAVAVAVASGLREAGAEAAVAHVDGPASALEGLDLLVVGGPTHVHGLSSTLSRKGAIDQGAAADEPGKGVRGWLEALAPGEGRAAAAFDTRIEKPVLLTGSAARGIAKRLRRHGFHLVAEPESFFVAGSPGPLAPEELERAAEWGRSVALRVEAGVAVR